MPTVSCNITGGQPPPHEYTVPNSADMKSTAINVTPAIAITIIAWTWLFKQTQPIIVSSAIIIRVGLERSKPSDGPEHTLKRKMEDSSAKGKARKDHSNAQSAR